MVESKADNQMSLNGLTIAANPNSGRRYLGTGKTLPKNTILKPSTSPKADGRNSVEPENIGGITLVPR